MKCWADSCESAGASYLIITPLDAWFICNVTRASIYELENVTYIKQDTKTSLYCFCGWE